MSVATPPAPPSSPLKNPGFRTFLFARLVSASGTAMAPVALAFTVLGQDSRPTALAVVLAGNMLPQLVLLLAGGVVADRIAPRALLVSGHVLAALSQGAVALVAASGRAGTGTLVLLACVTGGATAWMQPTINSVLPRLVGREQLQSANTLLRLPSNLLRVVAPALGGVLVATVGPQWTLGWDAASFLLAGLLCARLPVRQAVRREERGGGLRADFREGWQAFRSRSWLWSYVLSGTAVVALWLGGYQLLGPVVLKEQGRGAAEWGTVQGAFAVGLVLGGVLALRWRPERLMIATVCAGLPMAIPLLALASGAGVAVLALSTALAGVGLDLSIVWWNTAIQQELPGEVLGRVSSYVSIGEQLAVPLGYVIIGLTATSAGTPTVLAWCGVLLFLSGAVLLAVPGQWEVRRGGVAREPSVA